MGFDFDTFVAECPLPIAAVGERGEIVRANRALASLLGYGLDELEGRSFGALVPPEVRPLEGSSWPRTLEDAVAAAARRLLPLVHRSGVSVECEWEVLSGHDDAGRDTAVFSFRRRPGTLEGAGQPPMELQQVHAIVFRDAPIGIYHYDARRVLTACNDPFVQLIGGSRQQLIGLHLLTLPNREIVAKHETALAGEIARYEGLYVPATGRRRTWIRLVISPTKDEAGRVNGGVGIVEDVGEAHQAREIVARTERLTSLGTLAAGVVHEMQNPLAYATTNIDVALRQLPQGSQTGALLEAAKEGLSRAVAIVRDLRTFAKNDDAPRAEVRLADVVETAIKLTQGTIRAHARVEHVRRASPTVWASEGRLVQVVVNLLLNAAEAIATKPARDEDERITVTLDGDPTGRATIEVRDTGPGLSAEAALRLFEPFWTEKQSGLGLGLSLCHGIVASLGGEIYVGKRQSADERGARIVVALPSWSEEARPPRSTPPPRVAPAAPPASRAKPRVLVVDDEHRLAETLRIALDPSYEVSVATRGREAVESLTHGPTFDLVLCDLLLPDLTGPRVYAAAVAARPELAARFVFLTGGAFTEELSVFLQEVDNPRLEKPFDLATLEQLVAERLAALGIASERGEGRS